MTLCCQSHASRSVQAHRCMRVRGVAALILACTGCGPDVDPQLVRETGYVAWYREESEGLLSCDLGPGTSDDHLRRLEPDLRKCESLGLVGTKITDEGLVHLKELRRLKILVLADTAITDDGLRHVAALPALEVLNLSRTPISDQGLAHLKRMRSLDGLALYCCSGITDGSIAHLRDMTWLKSICLDSSQLTPSGLHRLREALPNCAIEVIPGDRCR